MKKKHRGTTIKQDTWDVWAKESTRLLDFNNAWVAKCSKCRFCGRKIGDLSNICNLRACVHKKELEEKREAKKEEKRRARFITIGEHEDAIARLQNEIDALQNDQIEDDY